MKRPARRKAKAPKKPAKRKRPKAKKRTITLLKSKKKPIVRVKLPRPKKQTERQIEAKQDKVMHRAARLAVEDIARLTSFKLTERELDRLSRDVERMIRAFEGLEKVVGKKKRKR